MSLEFTPVGGGVAAVRIPLSDRTSVSVPRTGVVSLDGDHHGFYSMEDCDRNGRLSIPLSGGAGTARVQIQEGVVIAVSILPGRFTTVWERIRTNDQFEAFRAAVRERKGVLGTSKLLPIYNDLNNKGKRVIVFIPHNARASDIAPDPRRYVVVLPAASTLEFNDGDELSNMLGLPITVMKSEQFVRIGDPFEGVRYKGREYPVLDTFRASNGYIFVIGGAFLA